MGRVHTMWVLFLDRYWTMLLGVLLRCLADLCTHPDRECRVVCNVRSKSHVARDIIMLRLVRRVSLVLLNLSDLSMAMARPI
jgi:hypothetical protein